MTIELINKNLFENSEEGILLTIDGAAKVMEGNLARSFARLNPEAWEEIEYELQYPIPLGVTKIFNIHPDVECNNRYCFIASTLNHLDTLSTEEKLNIQSSALRMALSLAESRMVSSVASAVMLGGWRLELKEALGNMLDVYQRAETLSNTIPLLRIYIMASSEYESAIAFVHENYSKVTEAPNKAIISL